MRTDIVQDTLQPPVILNFDQGQQEKKQKPSLFHIDRDKPKKTPKQSIQTPQSDSVGIDGKVEQVDKSLFRAGFLEAVVEFLSSDEVEQTDSIQSFVANVSDWLSQDNDRNDLDDELNIMAIHLLFREMGVTKAMRFIQRYTDGDGDYTQERDPTLGDMTLDEIYNEILEMRQNGTGSLSPVML